ncbi:MAG TPA: YggS family pyridoxal phosphate-dependent enzyme [Bacteroidia bacterium]|nr:YggS family pyridoxal phosphate-dependent enzyme [Bacteroidia bacterium]
MNVAENLKKIKAELPASVTLIAVSKTKPVELIKEAYDAGQRDFGENYIQELEEKHKQLPTDIRWHAIGHLQSNKVKYIAPFVHLIHAVDSLKLLQEINKQALKNNRVIDCLLQIHIAQEETKFGFSFVECEEMFKTEEFKKLQNMRVVGFMGMATNTDNETQIKTEFQSLNNFYQKIKGQNPHISILSMGMSGDYKIAIAEGSTMIRIGSSIFGERNYNKS